MKPLLVYLCGLEMKCDYRLCWQLYIWEYILYIQVMAYWGRCITGSRIRTLEQQRFLFTTNDVLWVTTVQSRLQQTSCHVAWSSAVPRIICRIISRSYTLLLYILALLPCLTNGWNVKSLAESINAFFVGIVIVFLISPVNTNKSYPIVYYCGI
jgi:hypothetical protein